MQGVYVDTFHTQKAGNAESEYEDAFWRPRSMLGGPDIRTAVADGATDAVYSGLWARLLVKAYGKRSMRSETIEVHLAEAAHVWERIVQRSRPLPWYAEEK